MNNNNNNQHSKAKQKALEELSKLNEDILLRLAEISKEKKALKFFESAFMFAILKGYLKKI